MKKGKKVEGKKENEKPVETSGQRCERENKTLIKILVTLGILIILGLIGFSLVNSMRHFEYRGVKLDAILIGEVLFYHTSIPVYSLNPDKGVEGRKVADYNIYLRKDPRELRKLDIKDEIAWTDTLVLNSTGSFECEGQGVIAVANLDQVLSFFGTKVVKDPSVSCDPQGRYIFVNMEEGEETYIEQIKPSCYVFHISNCEILDVTERFMFEKISEMSGKKLFSTADF